MKASRKKFIERFLKIGIFISTLSLTILILVSVFLLLYGVGLSAITIWNLIGPSLLLLVLLSSAATYTLFKGGATAFMMFIFLGVINSVLVLVYGHLIPSGNSILLELSIMDIYRDAIMKQDVPGIKNVVVDDYHNVLRCCGTDNYWNPDSRVFVNFNILNKNYGYFQVPWSCCPPNGYPDPRPEWVGDKERVNYTPNRNYCDGNGTYQFACDEQLHTYFEHYKAPIKIIMGLMYAMLFCSAISMVTFGFLFDNRDWIPNNNNRVFPSHQFV